jgi:hypothetical protein
MKSGGCLKSRGFVLKGPKENQKQADSAALEAFCYAFFWKMLYKMRGFWFSRDFLATPRSGKQR